MMMRNERGSILALTVCFVLVFTMLGFSAIQLATTQDEIADKERASLEAFWLADGALERAKSKMLVTNSIVGSIDNYRSYATTVRTDNNAGFFNSTVEATGTVNNKKRKIQSEGTVDFRGIVLNIKNFGTGGAQKIPVGTFANPEATGGWSGVSFSGNGKPDFDQFFPGVEESDIINVATKIYTNPTSIPTNLSYVTVINNNAPNAEIIFPSQVNGFVLVKFVIQVINQSK